MFSDTPLSVIIAAGTLIIGAAGAMGTMLVYDVTNHNTISNLSETLKSYQIDLTQQLRDIKIKVDATAVLPVKIEDAERRIENNERRLDAAGARLSQHDIDMSNLRNSVDSGKAAFSNIFPRIEKLEGHQGRYQGLPQP